MPGETAVDTYRQATILRRLLWLRHGCDGLYGDDGEMQCGTCLIDFKRMPAEDIERRFTEIGLSKLYGNGGDVKLIGCQKCLRACFGPICAKCKGERP